MVIVGEFVGGAALGAAFGLLFDAVKKAVGKPGTFKPLYENIKFSLKFLKPMIEKIGEHNVELGIPDEETKYIIGEMEEGVKLVDKSSKVSKWSCMKYYYTDQLIELDLCLKRLLDILLVQGVRDGKETLVLARKHQEKLSESARDAKEILVLVKENNDKLTESAKDGKETLDMAKRNNEQLIESAKDGKETLILTKNIKRFIKRIECFVRCSYKGKTRYSSGIRVSKASTSVGRGRISGSSNLRVFRYAELKNATQNFRQDKLGRGAFRSIFKGWIDETTVTTLAHTKVGTGMAVAVKRCFDIRGSIEQWQLELNLLGRVSHPNIVRLFGYCSVKKEMLLVYEFMPNRSLEYQLFEREFSVKKQKPLSWDNRFKIALGVACGIDFLHSINIIHRAISSSKILLDEDYNPKISDFSSVEWGSTDDELDVSTGIRGVIGYTDPEYLITGHCCLKSDVYSYGVLLLEILTGLKTFDISRPEDQINLVDWATPFLCDEMKLQTIMDEHIRSRCSSQEALQTGQLVVRCLETDPENRPSMKEVVDQLQNIQALKGQQE